MKSIYILYEEKLCEKNLFYINKDIKCEQADVIKKTGYAGLRSKLNSFIKEQQQAKRVSNVSIYFRDLNHGPVFGINELETFSPASLLKLPVAMMYLKLEEETPGLLSQNLTYNVPSEKIPPQPFPPPIEFVENSQYTIKIFLFNMIAYSDNGAAHMLLDNMKDIEGGEENFSNTLKELGIIQEKTPGDEIVTTRGQASLFTFLYNASYLNEYSSNQMLVWLSQTSFKEGLLKYLPKGTVVAHKFGTRGDQLGVKQLHDCGIIYYPGNPYNLCIMTKGDNWGDLADVIANISDIVYKEVDSRRIQ